MSRVTVTRSLMTVDATARSQFWPTCGLVSCKRRERAVHSTLLRIGSLGQSPTETGEFSRCLIKCRLSSSALGDVFKGRDNSAESTVGLEQRFRIDRDPRQTAVRFVDSHNDLRGASATSSFGMSTLPSATASITVAAASSYGSTAALLATYPLSPRHLL